MQQVFLSDVELYYSHQVYEDKIIISDEEFHHIKDVMRHKVDDEINITDGKGKIYKCKINEIKKRELSCVVFDTYSYKNKLSNLTFCIPRLKNADRLEFALEKCVELGVNNFIVFDSERTVAKGDKTERWQKIVTSAMKQTLRAWLPKVSYCKSISDLIKLDGKKIFFEQNADTLFSSIVNAEFYVQPSTFLVFGPEGGFTSEELRVNNEEISVKLVENRLRSETAVVVAASIISANLIQ